MQHKCFLEVFWRQIKDSLCSPLKAKISHILLISGSMLWFPAEGDAKPLTEHQIKMAAAGWVFHTFTPPYSALHEVWYRPYPVYDTKQYDCVAPLYFRHKSVSNGWEYYRSTNFLVPAYHASSFIAREAVEGFKIDRLPEKSKGIQFFYMLGGAINLNVEPTFFYEVKPQGNLIESAQNIRGESDTGRSEAVAETNKGVQFSTRVPGEHVPSAEAGLFIRLWNSVSPVHFDTMNVQWVYDQFMYFSYQGRKYRAVYFADTVVPGGARDVFGFEVSKTGGLLLRFSVHNVSFLNYQQPPLRCRF